MWVEQLKPPVDGRFAVSGERNPGLILCFGHVEAFDAASDDMAAIRDLKIRYPSAHVVGCSTGAFVEGRELRDQGLSALAAGFEHTRLRVASERLTDHADCEAAGAALGRALADDGLVLVYVLSEGLNVQGSALLRGLNAAVGQGVVVSGGMAGDGPNFVRTFVLSQDVVDDRRIAAIGFYGDRLRVACGSAGGWVAFGPERIITSSDGNLLATLDGVRALDIYEAYLGDEAADLPGSALFYPLTIWDPAHPDRKMTRTVLSIDRERGTMSFAGDMPAGWRARFMQGRADRLIGGAAEAAGEAMQRLGRGGTLAPSLCLMVSCVGRHMALGQRTIEEAEAVADVVGDGAVIAGFYSNGEFSPHGEETGGELHNQTMTLTLLTEAA